MLYNIKNEHKLLLAGGRIYMPVWSHHQVGVPNHLHRYVVSLVEGKDLERASSVPRVPVRYVIESHGD